MLSRRLVRIKSFQTMYAFGQLEKKDTNELTKLYQSNINNLQQAYLHCLWFVKALDYFLLSEIDVETSKYFPEKERIRKFKLLANNSLIPIFDKSKELESGVKKMSISWDDEGDALNRFLKELVEKDFVQDYLVFDEPNFKVSKKFILQLLEFSFGKNKTIAEAMENAIITWQDDKRVVVRALVDTINKIDSDTTNLPIYDFTIQAKEEVLFGEKLVKKASSEQEQLFVTIQSYIKNWELDRIAFADQIIIVLACCEFLYFKDIPIKVTINEYLEIAKMYSTPQSSRFINGVLDSLKEHFTKEGKIEKNAKGLRDK